jgi:hypothetical protein
LSRPGTAMPISPLGPRGPECSRKEEGDRGSATDTQSSARFTVDAVARSLNDPSELAGVVADYLQEAAPVRLPDAPQAAVTRRLRCAVVVMAAAHHAAAPGGQQCLQSSASASACGVAGVLVASRRSRPRIAPLLK